MARKEKQYHFIYKTTNLLNGKYYYGMHSTDKLNDGYYGSGRRLKRSLNKYGKENHVVEVLEHFPNRKELIEREREIINLNEIAKDECMNLMVGGTGGFISEEQQHHRSVCGGRATASRLLIDAEFREQHRLSTSNNMKLQHQLGKIKYDTFTNKKHSEESKRIMSTKASIRTGDKNSQYGTCWITKDGINKKIKIENLDTFILSDWTKGRIILS
jgi:hypothetical protein